MARTSTVDPLEKFRFRITVLSLDISVTGALDTIAGLSGGGTFFKEKLAVISRSGFSEITLPKVRINEMTYRENIDAQRFTKVPGLAKYDNITLKRGVTVSRDLYDWYRLVNEEMALMATAQELTRDAKLTPAQSSNFRKDVIIEVLDRKGEPVKAWYLFNAFPVAYSGGDGLNAGSEEKLVEELELSYEFFLELEGGPDGFAKEIAKGLTIAAAAAAANAVGGAFSNQGFSGGGDTAPVIDAGFDPSKFSNFS